MKVKKIHSQIRSDYWADMECEFCGHIHPKVTCYADANFDDRVIPAMKCKACDQSTAGHAALTASAAS